MIDYSVHLDAMWQKHLAPREPDAPTVVSTFAGAGGSSLGYSMAGFRELLAVEWDNNAVETFKLNFPGVPVYHGDIAALSVDECLSMAGIEPGELDVLDGSPPCQGFSTAGMRNMDDPRNQLFREYVRLLRGLRPKVFVMENVSGMVKGKMKLVFVEILKELKASGYRVSARLLNAMYFHVPQSRERIIFIGVRDDLGIEPTHPRAEGRPVIVREAIAGCSAVLEAPSWRPFNLNLWNRQRPGDNGINGKYFNHVRMDFNKPSPTIPKSTVFGGFAGLYHCTIPRSLNLGELRRIGSYPDEFQFRGNYESGLNRIGNSVPPLFMEAIARHIRQEMLSVHTVKQL
jgi:DNA (cytosine-5)-methyltransferase 1